MLLIGQNQLINSQDFVAWVSLGELALRARRENHSYRFCQKFSIMSTQLEEETPTGTTTTGSLACQTFHSAKGEEKSGNLPIPFWCKEFGIILRYVNGMLILCCHVQWTCTCRVW